MMLSSDNTFRILHWLRLAAMCGQLLAIGAAEWLLGPRIDVVPLLAISGLYALWHAGLLYRVRAGRVIDQQALTLEILVDLVTITALLCLAGGWTNPFASTFLVPLGFAAGVLTLPRAVLMVAAAFVGYG